MCGPQLFFSRAVFADWIFSLGGLLGALDLVLLTREGPFVLTIPPDRLDIVLWHICRFFLVG